MKMISKFIKDNALQVFKDEDEIEPILYGLKILGTSILTAMIVLLSGVILGQAISAIIYLCVLILLRRNVGGYHSKTYLGCLFISILNFIIIVFLQNSLKQYYKELLGIAFTIYSTIKIYTIKPQVHKNRFINKEAIDICNRKKNINLSIILLIASIIHIVDKLDIINTINYLFVISCSLMIVALSVNKTNFKEENENEENLY